MARYLDATPFTAQDAVTVDDEGAAFDAPNLFPIHVFHFHYCEQVTDRFVGVGAEFEGQCLFGLEVFVRFNAVPGNAQNYGVDRNKAIMEIAKLLCFGRAARRAVLGIEIDNDDLAGLGRQVEDLSAGGGQGEVGDFRVQHVFAPYR